MYNEAGPMPGSAPTHELPPTPLECAHLGLAAATTELSDLVEALRSRLVPVSHSDETSVAEGLIAVEGPLRSTGESQAVSFIRDQQSLVINLCRKLDDITRRLDV